MVIYFLQVFFLAFVISCVLVPVSIKLAHKIGAVDVPKDGRRMHTKPTPRFGGLAIFVGTTIALVWATYQVLPNYLSVFSGSLTPWVQIDFQPVDKMLGVIVGGILIYILGIIDDLKNMPAKVKFLGQIAAATVAYILGVRITFLTSHFGVTEHIFVAGALSYIITILWIVGLTNAVNLIDGLDGLAAGISAIASLCLAYTAYIHGSYLTSFAMMALAGGAVGFLPWNFHPAKTFMGDGGSLFLGFMLASTSVIGPMKGATLFMLIAPVLVLFVPIFDTGFAILRRVANKRPIMEADKGHLHHRLMAAGFGQRRTVLMLYSISGIMGIAAVLFSRDLFVEMTGLIGVAAICIYVFLTDAKHVGIILNPQDVSDNKEESAGSAETGKGTKE